MEIPGLSSANQALSLVGSITDLVKKGATIELQTVIIGLKEAILTLKDENLELRERLNELERGQSQKEALVFKYPNYYSVQGDGLQDGPFCQVCYDTNNKSMVRLQERKQGLWVCGGCKNTFQTKEHQQEVDAAHAEHNRRQKERFKDFGKW